MEISKLKNYSDFLGIIEYPAVLFCDDGEVLGINNMAVKIMGSEVETITMEPDKFMLSDDFWDILSQKKSIIWHRLGLVVNSKETYVTSGFVNQFEYDGKKAYMVLFELRSDVSIGSVSLERIINHVGLIALYLYKPDRVWKTRYISKNISEYGYTEGGFYKGLLGLSDILVKSDYDLLIGQLYKADNTGNDDFEMEVRIVAANKSIRKANLKCHIVRTSGGEADGIEFLFIKSGQPDFDEQQNAYILSAMNKIKSFVLVQRFESGRTKFEYITPNAKNMGINIEALEQGNKLIE
ncbi:MAG: GAF domain protein, partial [Coprococcus sp.]